MSPQRLVHRKQPRNRGRVCDVAPSFHSLLHSAPMCSAMGWIVPPHAAQFKCVEVLTSVPQNVAEIGERNLKRGNQVKIRSLWWALTQYGLCPYWKRRLGHRDDHVETLKEGSHLEAKGRNLRINQSFWHLDLRLPNSRIARKWICVV